MQKRVFITLFLCLSSYLAAAQVDNTQADEGTVYSQFGIGFPVDFGSSSADGMGILGVSYIEPYVPSVANPAHWGSTVYGMATGGAGIQNFNAKDNFGSAKHSFLGFNYFQLQLPVYKNKLGVSASFAPYSRAAFQVLETGSRVVGSGAELDTLNFQTQNTGDGGVNRFEFGIGWKINKNISIGYAASLLFASIDNEFLTTFENSGYSGVTFTQQTSAKGLGNRAGVYFSFPSVAGKDDKLSFGATVDFPATLKGELIQENTFGSGDNTDTQVDNEIVKGDIQLPLGLTAGITYRFNNKTSLTTEGLYQKWSNYKNDFNASQNGIFTDRYKIGAGLNYFPFVTGSDKFLSHFKYRLGTSYDTGHLTLNNENIDTIMFSAGLGILSSRSNSTVDLSFEYGIRGTKSSNLVKENIWGIKLSLNLAELFFFRPKLQ